MNEELGAAWHNLRAETLCMAIAADLLKEWGSTDSPFASGGTIAMKSRSSKLALCVSCTS
jgi:hypothetical protein